MLDQPLPRIVFLDRDSLPWPVRKPGLAHDWQEFPNTDPDQRLARLRGATVAISNKVMMDRELLQQLPELTTTRLQTPQRLIHQTHLYCVAQLEISKPVTFHLDLCRHRSYLQLGACRHLLEAHLELQVQSTLTGSRLTIGFKTSQLAASPTHSLHHLARRHLQPICNCT